MQFDLSAVETATMVFIGTLVFALVLAAFVLTAGFLALVLVGVGKLAWFVASTTLLAVVHGINHGLGQAGPPRLHRGDSRGLPGPALP